MVSNKKWFFGLIRSMLENAIQGKNISEYDIIQHTQITSEKLFFVYHKLGWDME